MATYPYLSRQAIATAANNPSVTSGFAFDVRNVAGFTRISGVASIIGSASIRMRGALKENGPFITSSTWSVNSGVSLFDAPNYVNWMQVDVTAITTQSSANIGIWAEPVR
jgi:hypothetical protein